MENAYRDNLRYYKNTIPQIFWYNGFIILSNGSQSKIGSMTAEWEHFAEWKKINSEGEEGIVSLDTMIRGTCEPARLFDRPFNVISVIDHMLWSAGQTMWRVGGGLLGLDLPPDATPEDRDAALDSLGDINAKTVLAFPDGYKANVLNTASAVLNPAPYFESAIVQLAGVTEYPKSILYGLATGAVTGSQLDRSTYYSKVVVKQQFPLWL